MQCWEDGGVTTKYKSGPFLGACILASVGQPDWPAELLKQPIAPALSPGKTLRAREGKLFVCFDSFL